MRQPERDDRPEDLRFHAADDGGQLVVGRRGCQSLERGA